MNCLFVFNHPYMESYCSAILKSAKAGLEKKGNRCEVINLDEEGFNPVVTKEFLSKYRSGKIDDPGILRYQKSISKADHLVLIFPIWWEAMPALMKGWIDKTITKGFAYDVDKSGKLPRFIPLLKNLKKVTLITTMDSPSLVYRFLFGNAVKKMVINGTFKKIGVKNCKWISFDRINSAGNSRRIERLLYIENYFASL